MLTVSPVPLVATATGEHVLTSTIYSKSVLRVAAEEIVRAHRDMIYFPAYEIVTGPQAPAEFFEPDRRNVTRAAVDVVMAALLAHCETDAAPAAAAAPAPAASPPDADSQARALSKSIADAECEEAMADRTAAE